tara:strand:- start:142 stop:498 length:357 start_codon:yes stop_codon:yes gene_type:complete
MRKELGDKQGAIDDYSQAITIDPQNTEYYVHRAALKDELGDKQGAIDDYSQAIAIDPQNSVAYYNRGVVLEDAGDLVNAYRDWRVAASLGHADGSSWLRQRSLRQRFFARLAELIALF